MTATLAVLSGSSSLLLSSSELLSSLFPLTRGLTSSSSSLDSSELDSLNLAGARTHDVKSPPKKFLTPWSSFSSKLTSCLLPPSLFEIPKTLQSYSSLRLVHAASQSFSALVTHFLSLSVSSLFVGIVRREADEAEAHLCDVPNVLEDILGHICL